MAKALSGEDRKFVLMARPMGLAEIKMAQIAKDYASDPKIKQFADRIIQDHTSSNRQLMQLVKGSDISVPDAPDREHEKLIDRLWSLEGEEFDREFMRAELRDHEQAVNLYQREASSGEDSDLKAFAQDCVPILQEHLSQAKSLARSVGI